MKARVLKIKVGRISKRNGYSDSFTSTMALSIGKVCEFYPAPNHKGWFLRKYCKIGFRWHPLWLKPIESKKRGKASNSPAIVRPSTGRTTKALRKNLK